MRHPREARCAAEAESVAGRGLGCIPTACTPPPVVLDTVAWRPSPSGLTTDNQLPVRRWRCAASLAAALNCRIEPRGGDGPPARTRPGGARRHTPIGLFRSNTRSLAVSPFYPPSPIVLVVAHDGQRPLSAALAPEHCRHLHPRRHSSHTPELPRHLSSDPFLRLQSPAPLALSPLRASSAFNPLISRV